MKTSQERWDKAQKAEAEYQTKTVYVPELTWSETDKKIRSATFKGSVLEVGCGPYAAIHDLNADSKTGIDPLEQLHHCSVKHFKGLGESLPFPDRSFDTVLSLNSLDHMISPSDALREMRRVLKPDGQLILTVNTFPLPKIVRDKLEQVDTPHPFHFSSDEVIRLVTNAGFVLQSITTERLPFKNVNSIKVLVAWLLHMGSISLTGKP